MREIRKLLQILQKSSGLAGPGQRIITRARGQEDLCTIGSGEIISFEQDWFSLIDRRRRRTNHLVVPTPMDGQTTPGPAFGPAHKHSANRIVVHIGHSGSQIAQATYRAGEVPGTPEPPPGSLDAVVPHGVHAQQELHDPA